MQSLCLSILLLHCSVAVSIVRFYPFGASTADQRLPPNDDETYMTPLSTVFPFFDVNYTTLYVNNNGLISFSSSLPDPIYIPVSLPIADNPFVAPFWADVDTRGTGTVWIRETKNFTILDRAREDIEKAFDGLVVVDFQPHFAIIATWDRVGYFSSNTDLINSFQCVLVSDGSLSFAIFIYGAIQWIAGDVPSGGSGSGDLRESNDNAIAATPALVGVNVGDNIQHFTVSESLSEDIININITSNINIPGIWIFQVNGDLTTETLMEAVASMLAQIVEQIERNEVQQNGIVLDSIANNLVEFTTFLNDSNVIINSTVIENIVYVISSLLQWNPANIVVNSSSRIIQSFEVIVYLFTQQLSLNETQNFTLRSLTVVSELRSIASLSIGGRSFAIGNNGFAIADEDQVTPGQLSPQQDAAISLPASLFQIITDREDVGIFFALYNTSTLFPVNGGRNRSDSVQRKVGSYILATTVGLGLNFQNLTENVTIVFRQILTALSSEMCVSWNFTLQDWTTEGCTTNVSKDGIVTCSCNHLTNFAILVDICIRQDGCQPFNPPALTYISYIGMSISIVSLLTTITTLMIFKKLRQKDPSKYHIQLSLAMLFMLITSFAVVAMSVNNLIHPYGGCVTVSVLVHYFTLVAVMWMGAEALLIFQKLVYVFYRITTKFVVSVSIICWTIPLVPVLIPLIVDLTNGNDIANDIVIHRSNSTEQLSFCFLSHPGAFWGAFLAPIFAIMLFNIFIFIRIIIVMVHHTRDTAARVKKPVSNKTIIRLMISIGGVMFLFGLTWLFAVLTFSVIGLRETFQILFTIFNSFQGFFTFLFVCVSNKEAVESWKELVSCGRYRSNLLRPSTATSAAMRKSKQASNTGSIGQSLPPETSKSYYASVTLSKGNSYEKAPLETKADFETNSINKICEQESDQTSIKNITYIETFTQEVSSTAMNNPSDNENKSNDTVGEKEGEMKKKITSLKVRFRRYSTKRRFKHHAEEAEVDFYSDSTSSNEEDDGTQL